MSVISGSQGLINADASAVHHVRTWSIETKAELGRIVSTATDGGSQRIDGNEDWTGQYTAYGHTPAVMPGSSFAFEGAIEVPTLLTGHGVSGTALVESIEIAWDVEAAAPIGHTVNFGGDGALTLHAGDLSVAGDDTIPDEYPSKGCKIQLGDVSAMPSFSDITDVRTMTLTITRSSQSYVSTETAGKTRRIAGNAWDFTLSASVYQGRLDQLPQPNESKHVRMFVDGTQYWELKWAKFGEIGGVEVDVESEAIVGATISGQMSGIEKITATPTKGFIKTPAGTTLWPAA